MDVEWCRGRLQEFLDASETWWGDKTTEDNSSWKEMNHLRPTVRAILKALEPSEGAFDLDAADNPVHERVLVMEGLGALRDLGVLGEKLAPAGPRLAADRLHGWIWAPAKPLWEIGQFRQALLAAATSINAHVQNKVSRRDASDDKLFQECFSTNPPAAGKPRLQVPGDPADQTVQSRQRGALSLALACVWTIRNPAAHLAAHDAGELDEQEAFEQLATLSTLARVLDDCMVITI